MSTRDLLADPPTRNLRIFAFDPSVAARTDTAGIGEITISIPWETDLLPGPVGEYLEVVDADPASGVFYKPVNLNDPRLLAQNGLAPSERNPQFHQQMVFAVAMTTIHHFEQALGRVALWSGHRLTSKDVKKWQAEVARQQDGLPQVPNKKGKPKDWEAGDSVFVRRLRIYPHALRDRNAYYSPDKKALLFGYFPVSILDADNTPGTLVFSCLSHDIVAHETTHALLDGVHPRFNEPVNRDVLAFHEAFADIVALFQHFSYPGILRDQIARTRGNLGAENLLGQLAQQFGLASGRGGALRNYLGEKDEKGVWRPRQPDVRLLEKTPEPHARGAILVAAVFGAFLNVYKARSADLYRIASDGTGVLREGEIHPDLATRLAGEARRAAQYTLQMCIRALDYCPPVGITFGDYLRAVVTADLELNVEDNQYRLAFVESFQKWGIHPRGRSSMSVEGLLWPTEEEAMEEAGLGLPRRAVKKLIKGLFQRGTNGGSRRTLSWNLDADREQVWKDASSQAAALHGWLVHVNGGRQLLPALGLVLNGQDSRPLPATVFNSKTPGEVSVEVHSVRTAIRRTPRGGNVTDLVVEITQRRRCYYDREVQKTRDLPGTVFAPNDEGDFIYRAGCTLLIDPIKMTLRRVIRTTGTITDDAQMERLRLFYTQGIEAPNAFDPARYIMNANEPFALLHQDHED